MLRVAIDVNGVLRDTISKITQIYEKNYLENQDFFDQDSFILDSSGDTTLEISNTIFKYEMKLPVTNYDLKKHFKFQNDEELYNFLYQEFPMQIFGHAGSTELSTFNDLNEIYLNYRDKIDFYIISNEIGKSKPATLFFLSKFGCLIERIHFFSNLTIKDMWPEINVLLTSNPDLLLNYPNDKKLIKFETDYNKSIECEYSINKIKDLENIIKTIQND
jgi:hypothetical protein